MSNLLYPEVIMSAYYQDNPEVKVYYRFEPQTDITAWESAKLIELFAYILATQKQCDWQAFVHRNALERHFIETELKEE